MTGLTQLRIAALCAFTYGLLLVSGLIHQFQRTGRLRVLVHGLVRGELWIVLAIAIVVTFGLWRRQAWAWWLALAASLFQVGRILLAYVRGPAFGRVPGTTTLIALALLLLVLVLLAPRKARLAANR